MVEGDGSESVEMRRVKGRIWAGFRDAEALDQGDKWVAQKSDLGIGKTRGGGGVKMLVKRP